MLSTTAYRNAGRENTKMSPRKASAQYHSERVQTLRRSLVLTVNPRQTALNRAVIECVRNPVVARAVARGLRLHLLEKV